MANFYDTHSHLDCPDFSDDLEGIIKRAHEAGVVRIISVGTDLDSSARAVQIAERHPSVSAVVGWHPNDALRAPDDLRPALRTLAQHPKVVAIGETGLDYYRLPRETTVADTADVIHIKQKQRDIFEQQMELAVELGLNCVVHQRGSLEDTLAQMTPYVGKLRAVFHCFSEAPSVLARIMDMGFYASFTGILTFKNAETVCESLAAVPRDRFMLETDCPFLAPIPYRGKRCEPAYLMETAKIAAEVRKCSLEDLSKETCGNADRFFRRISVAKRQNHE